MNKRIGLFTEAAPKKKNGPTTTASYVDIIAAADLTEKLVTLGAKKVALLRKDRLGTTHIEGKMFSVSELKDEHVAWATARAEQFETRGIYYAAE